MAISETSANLPKTVIPCLTLLFLTASAWADGHPGVTLPTSDDKYSGFVRQLEAGQTNIDYTDFRESFLESQQFKVASKWTPDLSALRKQVHELMMRSKFAEIIDITTEMLSVDYTDMEAHKILQQTYKTLGDIPNSNKYRDIELGLLTSIVRRGDGKTCQTAWPIIQVNEEYFILQMLGAKLQKQSIDNTGGMCDKMEVQTNQGNGVYYFEISKVFKGYNIQGIH